MKAALPGLDGARPPRCVRGQGWDQAHLPERENYYRYTPSRQDRALLRPHIGGVTIIRPHTGGEV